MPENWSRGRSTSHAVIWGVWARDAAGLTEAVLVNQAKESRRLITAETELDPDPNRPDTDLGLHAGPPGAADEPAG